MGRLEMCLAGKIYELKRNCSLFSEFGKRMQEVKSELNKGGQSGTMDCKCGICGKCRR